MILVIDARKFHHGATCLAFSLPQLSIVPLPLISSIPSLRVHVQSLPQEAITSHCLEVAVSGSGGSDLIVAFMDAKISLESGRSLGSFEKKVLAKK